MDQLRRSSSDLSFLQRAHLTLSPALASLALYDLYILFLPKDPYPIIYSGLIMPKMEWECLFRR